MMGDGLLRIESESKGTSFEDDYTISASSRNDLRSIGEELYDLGGQTASAKRNPVLHDAQGKPQTNVTGRSFDLTKQRAKGSKFEGDRGDFLAQTVHDRKDLMTRILKKVGWNQEQITEAMPFLDGVLDVFNLDDVKFHEVLKQTHAGAATMEGGVRKMYLSGKGLDGVI